MSDIQIQTVEQIALEYYKALPDMTEKAIIATLVNLKQKAIKKDLQTLIDKCCDEDTKIIDKDMFVSNILEYVANDLQLP